MQLHMNCAVEVSIILTVEESARVTATLQRRTVLLAEYLFFSIFQCVATIHT